MLLETDKNIRYKRGIAALAAAGLLLVGGGVAGAFATRTASATLAAVRSARARTAARGHVRPVPAEARRQPHTPPRATISLYEHTVRRLTLRRQGCSAAKRGVGGIVILDFGQPAYDGRSYGTYLFSGRFAGNKVITRALFAYAYGYRRCLAARSALGITLARGTSNYHPQVPSAYRAGRRWARETMALQHLLSTHGLAEHVTSAAADDVEPSWDPTFHRTRDFYRGFRDARTGHTIYNYGSLDGGVGTVWNARQVFFVTSGMRYAQAIPEIYNHAMARQWAQLAGIARRRYHRPLRFAGVMTTHTSANHGMKPRDAHDSLVQALAASIGARAADVPSTLTNIRSAD